MEERIVRSAITPSRDGGPEDGAGPLELFRKAGDRLYAAKLIQRNHRAVAQLTQAAVSPPGSN